ncbi:MAG TPA: TraB/GumN family protein [Cellvibrionaceae bacterium]|nr:TraB/GumN family protein [Cellvibrionaceae bacterium]HMW72313.1 TraB/GumN family protein [Cellvibrionaceae bacterium]HMY39606.1 TraB/GumN family protein [Marinagarivorans sp.]HNG59584.1 TraB/GumN family protein [Cellvibrionaceae bacterium]
MMRFNRFIGVALLMLSQACAAATSLWEVSKNNRVFYLGASISALKQKHYPLPAEFDDAYKKAAVLYVERDIAAVSAQDFSAQVMQRMMYSDGGNLKKQLRPEVYQQLDAYSQSLGIPVFGLAMFKPAFSMVSLAAAQSAQGDYVYGVDTHYFYQAQESKKNWRALETTNQQLELLDKINQEEPNQAVLFMLDELKNMPATLNKLVPAWRTGNLAAVDSLGAGKMRKLTPQLYKALVVARHNNWLAQFNSMVQTPEEELVLLDIIHFTGPDSLLTLLKKNGFNLTPYRKT